MRTFNLYSYQITNYFYDFSAYFFFYLGFLSKHLKFILAPSQNIYQVVSVGTMREPNHGKWIIILARGSVLGGGRTIGEGATILTLFIFCLWFCYILQVSVKTNSLIMVKLQLIGLFTFLSVNRFSCCIPFRKTIGKWNCF